MNIQTLLALYLINSQGRFADRNINEDIANSIIYVIERLFVPQDSSFIIVMSYEREETRDFYKDLGAVLFRSYDDIKTQIIVRKGINTEPLLDDKRIGPFNYYILVVDSVRSFLNIDLASKVKNNDRNEYYHIFLHNKDRFLDADIKDILSYCWKHYLINVNVAIQKASGDIIVYTYFPFSESHCNEVVPVEINRFQNGVMLNAELFPQKLYNMHNCPVRVAPFHAPPFLSLTIEKNRTEVVGGFEGHLLKELSSLMNFTIDIILPPKREGKGAIYGNYTTGAMNMLVNRKVDVVLGSLWFTQARSQILTATYSYFQTSNVVVLVKNSLNYVSPNVLWFPYESSASVAIITSFLIMLSMVYIFEKCSIDRSTISKPRGRCLNFVAWTLGLPSHTLPIRTSRRIFAMTWLLFGLVIRSQYAGIIFHLLRNNLFRRSPSTLREVKSLNYTIILSKEGYNALIQTSTFADTGLPYRMMNPSEYGKSLFAYLEENSQEKLLIISPMGFLLYYLGVNHKADVLTILKENVMMQNICIYFSKHSFLVNRVNFLIQRINASGIIQFWILQQIDLSYLKTSRLSTAIVIGQRELEGIYYLWLAMMSFAVFVFCLEKLSEKFQPLKRIFDTI